jgi:hypothetical protein
MKDVRFIWGLPQENSFMKLKELVTSAPVLILPNDDLPFRLEADSSSIATGAVLSQQQVDDNAWHPVAFLPNELNPVERNYKIHDTKMLAIIRGLEEWRHYLEGARHPVEIWTDHKNLEYLQVAQKLNRRQARWSLYLSCFDFTLHHKSGRSMGKPDALSRCADHGSGQGDNNNMTLLALELFCIHALAGVRLEGEERNILRQVQRSLQDGMQEESVVKAARELRKDKSRGTVKSAELSESDGLLMFRSTIYLPKDRDLRRHIVKQHHDTCITGHAGRFETLELIACNYWWPQMSRYIGMYVKTCDLCNWTKVQCQRPIGELHPSETPEAPWDTISVDFIVELPQSHGYDTIMCIVDSLTKRVHFIPMHTTLNAEGTALLFLKEVWKHHGTPRVVVLDRGPQFIAAFTCDVRGHLSIS